MAEEQLGFRKGRCCADAVHVLRTVVEKSAEWGLPLWMPAVDVEKAFDRVHHADLFRALLECGVSARVVLTLRNFYAGLNARVHLWPGAESRDFQLQRGVRQGDPLSTLLFNLVMRDVLEEVEVIWKRRGYGSEAGNARRQHRLTYVVFADDVTLIASRWVTPEKDGGTAARCSNQARSDATHRSVRLRRTSWSGGVEGTFPYREQICTGGRTSHYAWHRLGFARRDAARSA